MKIPQIKSGWATPFLDRPWDFAVASSFEVKGSSHVKNSQSPLGGGLRKKGMVWIAIAKDRPRWRQQHTHSKPKPPDA